MKHVITTVPNNAMCVASAAGTRLRATSRWFITGQGDSEQRFRESEQRYGQL